MNVALTQLGPINVGPTRERGFIDRYVALLSDYAELHAELTEKAGQHRSIWDRINDIDGGDQQVERAQERRRACDKANIVLQQIEEARVRRDRVLIDIEALRFEAQIELDLTLSAPVLPL